LGTYFQRPFWQTLEHSASFTEEDKVNLCSQKPKL
jgi:hypothetical protein